MNEPVIDLGEFFPPEVYREPAVADPRDTDAIVMPICPNCGSNTQVSFSPFQDEGAFFCGCNSSGPRCFNLPEDDPLQIVSRMTAMPTCPWCRSSAGVQESTLFSSQAAISALYYCPCSPSSPFTRPSRDDEDDEFEMPANTVMTPYDFF